MITTLFLLATVIAVIGWATLILGPGSDLPARALAAVLGVSYLVTIGFYYWEGGSYPTSFDGLKALSQNPLGLLAMWTHYLAVDLVVGIWEVRDAQSSGMSRIPVTLCLLVTMSQGPAGVVLYLILKNFCSHRLSRSAA